MNEQSEIQRLTKRIQHLEAENERLTAQLVYARASLFSRTSPGAGTIGSERPQRPMSSPSGRPSTVSKCLDGLEPPISDIAAALALTPGPGEVLCDNWYVDAKNHTIRALYVDLC